MDDTDQELKNGTESIDDRIRRPARGLYSNRVITQNNLQGRQKRSSIWRRYDKTWDFI